MEAILQEKSDNELLRDNTRVRWLDSLSVTFIGYVTVCK